VGRTSSRLCRSPAGCERSRLSAPRRPDLLGNWSCYFAGRCLLAEGGGHFFLLYARRRVAALAKILLFGAITHHARVNDPWPASWYRDGSGFYSSFQILQVSSPIAVMGRNVLPEDLKTRPLAKSKLYRIAQFSRVCRFIRMPASTKWSCLILDRRLVVQNDIQQ